MLVNDIIILPKKKKQKARIWPERDKNLSDDKKQKLVEYRKKYYKMGKNNQLKGCSVRLRFHSDLLFIN